MRKIFIGVVVLLALSLAACTGATVPDEILLPDAPSGDESVSAEDPAPQGDQSEEVDSEVIEEPEVIEPREGLVATNPSTVVLASGEPQIVEFFAFW